MQKTHPPLSGSLKTYTLLILTALLSACALKNKPDQSQQQMVAEAERELDEAIANIHRQQDLLAQVEAAEGGTHNRFLPAQMAVPQLLDIRPMTIESAIAIVENGKDPRYPSKTAGKRQPENPPPAPAPTAVPKQNTAPALPVEPPKAQPETQNAQAEKPAAKTPPSSVLNRPVGKTFNGTMKITEATQSVASIIGYRFILKGSDKPYTIKFNQFNGTVLQFLKLVAGAQGLGNKGLIDVNTQAKTITLEYKNKPVPAKKTK